MKVLITGGAGFIGTTLARRLVDENQIVAFDNLHRDALGGTDLGDHPDPEAACAALTAVADPFGPVPPPDRCEEIPGSDEDVAVIAGDYRGRDVHSRFTRANACVSGRWDRIAPVFPTGS